MPKSKPSELDDTVELPKADSKQAATDRLSEKVAGQVAACVRTNVADVLARSSKWSPDHLAQINKEFGAEKPPASNTIVALFNEAEAAVAKARAADAEANKATLD